MNTLAKFYLHTGLTHRLLQNTLPALALGMVIGISAISSPVYAERLDDTSLYTGLSSNEPGEEPVDPNVLFIFDTSGSMGNSVPSDLPIGAPEDPGDPPPVDCTAQELYDPDCDYGDSSADYTYVYVRESNQLVYQEVKIANDQNHCKAMFDEFADADDPIPEYIDGFRQWRFLRNAYYNWSNGIRNDDGDDKMALECENDQGEHGQGANGASDQGQGLYIDRGRCYPGTCNADWRSSSDGGSFNTQRIFVPANYHDFQQCFIEGTCGGGGDGGGTGGSGGVGDSIDIDFDHDVDLDEVRTYGPFYAKPGYEMDIDLDKQTGNPDLYVGFGSPPLPNDYNCHPDYENSDEECKWTVQSSHNPVYVSVHGDGYYYNNGRGRGRQNSTYNLRIRYTSNGSFDIPDISNTESCDCDWEWSSSSLSGNNSDNANQCGFKNGFVNIGNKQTICQDKMSIMQVATIGLMEDLNDINVGLMRFNSNVASDNSDSGGRIVKDIEDIDATDELTGDSVRADIIGTVDDFFYDGNTPLAETLHEAHLYFKGGSELYGYVNGETDPEVFAGGGTSVYDSPITEQCAPNHVVLLTDGAPTRDTNTDTAIKNLADISSCDGAMTVNGQALNESSCLDDLAEYMKNTDHSETLDDSKVITHTIGFNVSSQSTLFAYLQRTAFRGGGQAYSVDGALELQNAFQSIIQSINVQSSTFVAPAVTVNAFNELQHRDEIYYATFEPAANPRWTGNVKKYRITSDGSVLDAKSPPQLAVDAVSGFFSDSAKSFWSTSVDGSDVSLGGFKEHLPASRTVFTTGDVEGALSMYALTTANTNAADLGLAGTGDGGAYTTDDETYADKLVNWALGSNVFNETETEANEFVADPLHGRPFVITYGCSNPEEDGSCLDQNIDDTLYAVTNLGFLHAVNARTGVEQFAILPGELLPNLKQYADPAGAATGKVYGLDGSVEVWSQESLADTDRNIEVDDGDFVRLFVGMRRGGTSFYAVDTTNRSAPHIDWQIDGPPIPADYEYVDADYMNAIADAADIGFEDMGQSWSTARKAKVNWACDDNGCTEKDVVIFTGGYDPRHDENTNADPDDTDLVNEFGNAIYMVDAVTGTLLWSGGNNDDDRSYRTHNTDVPMTHSIPASPGFADVDADGILDIIFAVDIAGGVWRFDLNKETTAASNFSTGGKIFELEEDNKFRRFYNRPDVVLNVPRADLAFLTMIIGSGYRSDPRDEVQDDQIYVLFEEPLFDKPEDTDEDGDHYNDGLVVASSLYNARAVDEIGDPVDPPNKETNANDGYYIPLDDLGEKVLQPSVTLNNVAVVTSYLPNGFEDEVVDPEAVACGNTGLGGARVYFLDINTGQSKLTGEFLNLNFSGIPVEPTIVFASNPAGGTTPVICVGTECFGEGDEPSEVLGEIDTAYRRYWRENVHGQGGGS